VPKTLVWVMTLAIFLQWAEPVMISTPVSSAPLIQAAGIPRKAAPVPATSSLSEQLIAAQQLQTIGDYDRAIETYQQLIAAAPADSAERTTAGFLLGQTYYEADRYTEAVKSLGDFVVGHPSESRYGRAVFLQGRSYQALNNWSAAIAQYQKYLTIDQTVASFVDELMGDCYAAASDYAAAAEVYNRGVQGPVDQPMKLHLLEGIVDMQTKGAKYAAAVATADALGQATQDQKVQAKAEYLAGQALAAAGRATDSIVRYRRAIDAYPKTQYAYLSLIELVNAGQAVDELQRGTIDYYGGGAYSPAAQAIERFLKTAPSGHADEARYILGLSYQALAKYSLAIQNYDYIITHYLNSASLGDAWIAKGKSLAGSGKISDACEVWAQFVKRYPTHRLAPEALWLTGATLEGADKFKEAAVAYASLQAGYPQADRAPAALHEAGLCAFRAQQADTALAAWRKLADGYAASSLRPAALFWLARLYHAKNNDDQARVELKEIKEKYPNDYYAVRADEFQETWNSKLFQKSAQKSMLLSPPTAAEQGEAEQWLLSWLPETGRPAQGESVSGLSDTLLKDGRLQRGLLLWQLDLTDDASAQIRGLKTDRNDSPLDQYRLGVYLNGQGLYRLSISCLDRLVQLAPVDKQATIPTFVLKLSHPLPFSDLVVTEAMNVQLDPLLILAMIRQESAFEWNVDSWVGARGLMQIMPATGDWIALQLAWKNYTTSILYRPYLNVRFGVWYMARQMATFNGDVGAALAAYNAGPGRIINWQTPEMSPDDDLFLESMPLSEPVSYVRRIYTHYSIYRKLYASP
jgi:soluble lytic murein transglycosylase